MPAGSTYTPIATTTLSSSTNSVTFSSISGSYTDIVVIFNGTADSGLSFTLNSDTGTNYSRIFLYGNGSAAGSGINSNVGVGYMGYAGDYGNYTINFQNYSNTTTYKTVLWRSSNAGTAAVAGVDLWRSTSAINSIKLQAVGSNIASGSTFTLYGILAA